MTNIWKDNLEKSGIQGWAFFKKYYFVDSISSYPFPSSKEFVFTYYIQMKTMKLDPYIQNSWKV